METRASTKYVVMTIEDGIFIMAYYPMELLDINIAKKIVKDRVSFKAGRSFPSLFDIRNLKSTSKEARDYMANEGNDLVTASALLVNSPLTKMIGNFFIAVSKPKNPTRLFIDKKKSLEWLKEYKAADIAS